LRRLVGPKRDEITQGWRGLYNEESCNLYSSPNIIRMIKSRGLKWERQVECMARKRLQVRDDDDEKPEGKI
jgi:hypothetical protein